MLNAVSSSLLVSQAHAEFERPQARSPRQLADELAQVYGRDFDQLTYLPGMALIGQLRLGNTAEVVQLAARHSMAETTSSRELADVCGAPGFCGVCGEDKRHKVYGTRSQGRRYRLYRDRPDEGVDALSR